jgi:hypothetical protein
MDALLPLAAESVVSHAQLEVRGRARARWASGAPLCAHGVLTFNTHRACAPQRGVPGDAVTHVAFDPVEEALWACTDGGKVATFTLPEFSRYAVAAAHPDRVTALLPLGGAALTLSASSLRLHSSGGVLQLRHEEGPEDAGGLLCVAPENPNAPRFVIGREASFLQTFDLATSRWGARVDAPGGTCVIAAGGRALACGSHTGARARACARAHPRSLPAHVLSPPGSLRAPRAARISSRGCVQAK